MFKFNFQVADGNLDRPVNQETKIAELDENEDVDESVESGVCTYAEIEELHSKEPKKYIVFKQLFLNKDLSVYESEDENDQEEENTDETETDKPSTSSSAKLKDLEKYAFVNYVDSYQLETNDEELDAINKTHDLVPGKYEGGLKVWELSIDLARLIYNVNFYDMSLLSKKSVLTDVINELSWLKSFFRDSLNDSHTFSIFEIGCGHALPTLSVVKLIEDLLSAESESQSPKIVVYLQDFNEKIVKNVTFENARKFLETSKLKDRIEFKFVYGDWKQIIQNNLVPSNFFNLILTSETIYNSANYKSLLKMFQKCLKKVVNDTKIAETVENINKKPKLESSNNGIVLLSAKTYYFGCGGNLLEFSKLAKSSTFSFKTTPNLLIDSVVGNYQFSDLNNQDEVSSAEIEPISNSIGKEIIKISY
jgi:hypothetical protein